MNNSHEIRASLKLPLDRFTLSVDLELTRHVTGIFGISGSGKTSLLETIAGLRRNARGILRVGNDIWQDSTSKTFVLPENRMIGYVPQDGLLFPHRNVLANLVIGQRRARRQGQDCDALLQDVIRLLELSPLLERRVDTLSGGERQRVALGRALCSGPRLMIMDEPLAALDLGMRRRLLPFLRTIRQSFDIPMLLVSHDPVEVQALCDDLVILRDGAVIARGEPRLTLTQASNDMQGLDHLVENVLPCRVERHEEDVTIVRLGHAGEGQILRLSRIGASGAGSTMVAVRSQDIIVSTGRPEGVSACNILPATVRQVKTAGEKQLVFCTLDGCELELAVEVTAASLRRLELTPGTPVFLLIKATALELC
ncbi:MAG: molybdenum ABC transporter ATP-binding protein [Thiogranum sp.]